ncbi:TonB-dependent receptor [Beijerinckia indica]|uniref:TonB-dependent receptor n=1 Tax=Beijerinckia indica TaxID=533 RepID=UPI0002E76336|nr:TonB-dependent receptor [Beijerinckia indica]
MPTVDIVSTAPLASGAGIDSNKLPGLTQTLTPRDFQRTYSPNVTDALQQRTPTAVSIDVNGNPLSQDLYYHGFVASPRQGTPQGLAVYQNGMRLNEPFGDTVNWDLVPPQAIERTDIFTNNPAFGLNALGGAVSIQMKNGFTWQGFEAQTMGGSYGRVSGMLQYGKQIDNFSVYFSADATRDGGWRYNSASSQVRLYGDIGYRTPDAEVHFIANGGQSLLGVVGPTPFSLVSNDYRSVFTSPQTTDNQAGSLALTSRFPLSATWTVNSNFYMRAFKQIHTDGNDANVEGCSSRSSYPGQLCLQDDEFEYLLNGGPKTTAFRNMFVIRNQNGQTIPFQGDDFAYGTIDRTYIHSLSVGTTLQATNTDKILGHDNHVTFGGSIDRSQLSFSSYSTLGQITPDFSVQTTGFPGSGSVMRTDGNLAYVPTYLNGNTTYYGVYVMDTFDVTPDISITGGGRLNIANIVTHDTTGQASELNINAAYTRINPIGGLTWRILPTLTAYAGYSEANRAPTPLELDCANPTRPCILENSLTSDPPLQQVVSRTVEAGLRGSQPVLDDGSIDWKLGYFRTANSNDIITLASTIPGRGYYANVPGTLRQGLELGIEFHTGDWLAYLNYGFVDATYQFSGALSSPNNPYADANGDVFVHPGNHIPGIPQQMLKFGADYKVTPQFTVGGDVLIIGSQYYVGDNSNQNPKLPSYWVANLHASYQVNEHIQFFGLINNLFNQHYATYGTFYGTDTNAQLVSSIPFTNDPRTITAAQPISFYGGMKVTF